MINRWKSWLRTAEAMLALGLARMAVAAFPFDRWRNSIGAASNSQDEADTDEARHSAWHVERAAQLSPFSTKCLPRAMALSWILRSRGIAHCVVFAVRPPALRGSDDQLHAWLEVAGETIMGDLPGPWVETLRIGDDAVQMGTRSI